MATPGLGSLLAPDVVAVVGASPDNWYTAGVVENLEKYGDLDELLLVNPHRERAWDRVCYDGLDDAPSRPDVVVVCVPREVVPGVLREAAEVGAPAAVVLSAGFGEADDRGAALEDEVAAIAAEEDVTVLGPNCLGAIDATGGTVLTPTCSRRPARGGVGVVSQSGALAFTTLYERGIDEGVGFSRIVSTGNEADVTAADAVAWLADDDATDAIACYLEGLDDPRAFLRAAEQAVRGGTPVVTVKVGRSDEADEVARGHTGTVTGRDAAWTGALRQTGVERVRDVPALWRRTDALARLGAIDGQDVFVASTSGGLASLLADLADDRGLTLPAPGAAARGALGELEGLLPFDAPGNPADVRGAGADHLPAVADAVASEGYDAVLLAVGLSAVGDRAERIAEGVAAASDRLDVPLVAHWTGRQTPEDGASAPIDRLREAVHVATDPADAVDAVASLADADGRRAVARSGPSFAALERDRPTGETTGLAGAPGWEATAALLEDAGMSVAATRVAASPGEAREAAAAIGPPVVVKAEAPGLAHRDDAGAVATGVRSADEADEAYRRVVEAARDAGAAEPVALVQRRVEGVEAFVGGGRDPGFGPTVTVGRGGVDVEAVGDVATLVAPCTRTEVRAALDTTALPAVCERRLGDAERALDRLADVAVAVGDLVRRYGDVAELDCNPVVVSDDGAVAVDALLERG